MAKTFILTITGSMTGEGDTLTPRSTSTNGNAADPQPLALAPGNNLIQVPSGFQVGGVWLKPLATSTNVKNISKAAADNKSDNWTNLPIAYPCAPGGSFNIYSTGTETIEAWYF